MLFSAAVLGLLIVTSAAQKKPRPPKPDCSSGPDKGKTCGKNKAELRYYYDDTVGECLPFRYEGCGGNQNSFETPSSCNQSCKKAKPHRCGGGGKPGGHCRKTGDCSKGSVCRMGDSGSGVCCGGKDEEEFNRERYPKCNGEKVLIRTHTHEGWKPLLGKDCSQDFCPKFSKCVQGRHLAHCCGQKKKFRRHRA